MESRLGRSVDQNQTSFQTMPRTNNPPATATPASTTSQSTGAVPAEGVEPSSVLLWNRPEPSGWGQYRTDMSARLNMNTLTCREDARRMIGGDGPTVTRLYRIPGVDWLLAEQEQFSSATTLRFVDLDGLPQGNTFGPLNTRSLTDRRRRARELTPPARKANFWQRISQITSTTRCIGSSPSHPARRLVSTLETIPERPRWRGTIGDTRG